MMKLLILDCDGTMVDTQHHIVSAFERAAEALALPVPPAERVRRVVGLSLGEAIANVFPDLGRNDHADLLERYKDAFLDARQQDDYHEPLYPGLLEAIDELERDGWLLGIATGKARRGLNVTLGMHNLAGRFATLQTADVAAGKPHPEMILRAMAETGADENQTVMVGDTTFDIAMARNAGVHAVGVDWGYHHRDELRDAGAHRIIENFSDLARIAGQLIRGESL